MSKYQDLKTLYHCTFNLNYHLVIVTKHRRKCIDTAIRERLKTITADLCDKWEGELIEFNGESDHIHLLVSLNPKTQPSKFVNNFKTVSSRLIRKEFKAHIDRFYHKPVFWSRSYCLLTCGGAPLSVIKQYIQNQETES